MQVAPLDEELALRATFKSRLSIRQRTINHRSDLNKELGIMSGAIEDFASTCRQVSCVKLSNCDSSMFVGGVAFRFHPQVFGDTN